MSSPEEAIEKLDQEITLQLQKIDSNLSYCFNKITKFIIPQVTRYGSVCDDIMDSGNWLGTMFQQTAQVDLKLNDADDNELAKSKNKSKSPETLFPMPSGHKLVDSSTELGLATANGLLSDDGFHTANVTTTTTGRVLRLPSDSSDEDDSAKMGKDAEADGSTLQRQRRKRKVSLLLQQEYASSSSMALSPVRVNLNKSRSKHEKDEPLDSSPVKSREAEHDGQDESTKEMPRPGTIIHFSTGSGSGSAATGSGPATHTT